MSTTRFHALSAKGFPAFRSDLDRAVETSFAVGVLQCRWFGQGMEIKAPGAAGVVRFAAGRVTAEITISSFPATLLREQICADIRRMLGLASGSLVEIVPDTPGGRR